MRKRYFLLIVFAASCYLPAKAQDKDAVAKNHYIYAEEFFNKESLENYDSCVLELEKAEKALGATNPKILFLRIKSMAQSFNQFRDRYYIYDLDKSIKRFFEITDPKTYPEEKYSEIIKIKEDFTSVLKVPSDSFYKFRYSDSALLWRGIFYISKKLPKYGEIYLSSAAKAGNLIAAIKLGDLYVQRVNKNTETGRDNPSYFTSANWDDYQADQKSAEYYYGLAAKSGYFTAYYELAMMYYLQIGVPCCSGSSLYKGDDISNAPTLINKSIGYFSLAAEHHLSDAYYWLGNLYHLVGIHSNNIKAFQHYSMAAAYCSNEAHKADAVAVLGKMYDNGLGVSKNKALAKELNQRKLDIDKAIQNYNNGQNAIEQKMWESSLKSFETAISLDSNYTAAYLHCGLVCNIIKNYQSACVYFEKARNLDTSYFSSYSVSYSNSLANSGRFDEAVSVLNHYLLLQYLTVRDRFDALYFKNLYEQRILK